MIVRLFLALVALVSVLLPHGCGDAPAPLVELTAHTSKFAWLTFNHDGSKVALRGNVDETKETVRIWNIKENRYSDIDMKIDSSEAQLPRMRQFDFEGSGIFFGKTTGLFVTTDLSRPDVTRVADVPAGRYASIHQSLTRSTDNSSLWMQSIVDGKRFVINAVSGLDDLSRVTTKVHCDIKTDMISAARISGDGTLAVLGTIIEGNERNRYVLEFWDTVKTKKLCSRESHDDSVRSIAIDEKGKIVASGGSDGKLIIWNGSTGKICCSITEKYSISSIVIDSKAELLLFTSYAGEGSSNLKIIDLRTNKIAESLCVDSKGAHLVTLSPDKRLLAAVGSEGRVRIWKVTSLWPALSKRLSSD